MPATERFARHLANGSLDLGSLAEDWPAWARVLDCMPLDSASRLADVVVSNEGSMARGTLLWPGAFDLSLALESVEETTPVGCKLAADLGDYRLDLPGPVTVALAQIRFALECMPGQRVQGSLHADLHMGERILPLNLALPPDPDLWEFDGQFDPFPIPGLDALTAFIGAETFLENVPTAVQNIDGLTLTKFGIGVRPSDLELAHLSVGVRVQHWEVLAGKFSLEETDLDLFIPSGSGHIGGSLRGTARLAGRAVPLNARIDRALHFRGHIDHLSITQLAKRFIEDLPDAVPDLVLSQVEIGLSTAGDLSVRGWLDVGLDTLMDAFEVPVPSAFTSIPPSHFVIEAHPLEGMWELSAVSYEPLPVAGTDAGGLVIETFAFGLKRTPHAGTFSFCEIQLSGQSALAGDVSLSCDALEIMWDGSRSSWDVSGRAVLTILGRTEALDVTVRGEAAGTQLVLSYPKDLHITDFDGTGAAVLRGLSITLTRGVDGFVWGLDSEILLEVRPLFSTTGRATIEAGSQGPRLVISADAPQIPPLRLPAEFAPAPELLLTLGRLQLDSGTRAQENASRSDSWQITANATMQILGVPAIVADFLPTYPVDGTFQAGAAGVSLVLTSDALPQPSAKEFAFSLADDTQISLGTPDVRIERTALELFETPKVAQQLAVSVPAQLNEVLEPVGLGVFADQLKLELSMGRGLAVGLLSSPFREFAFYLDDEGRRRFDWRADALGTVSFLVPEFEFENGRWRGMSGFERQTDLAVPLGGLKHVLKASGVNEAVLAVLPDSLPLKDLDLMQAGLSETLRERASEMDTAVLDVVGEFLAVAQDLLHAMPTRMQEYFKIRIPKSGQLDIETSASGGMTFGMRTLGDEALRLLLPWFGPPLPALVGLTLKELSFGPKLGGAVVLVRTDGWVDIADLVSLTIALPLDQARDLSARVLLHKTTMIVPTGFPVAVPLFFDEIGLEYRDPLGLEIESRWSFPEPELSPLDWIQFGFGLVQFLTDQDFLLHREGLPEALTLPLTVGRNALRLPDCLGGQTLSLITDPLLLDMGSATARLFDGLKTGDASYFVEALPLRYPPETGTWIRVGAVELAVGPFAIAAQWCVTTRAEFVTEIVPLVKAGDVLSADAIDGIIGVVPDLSVDADAGRELVVLLMGEVDLAVFKLQAQFGLSISRNGCGLGLQWRGAIADRLALSIAGVVQLGVVDEAGRTGFGVDGRISLTWEGRGLIEFKGHFALTNQGFDVGVKFVLTHEFYLAGQLLVGPAAPFRLEGDVFWQWSKTEEPLQAKGLTQTTKDGVAIAFDAVLVGFRLQGRIVLAPPDALFAATCALEVPEVLNDAFAQQVQKLAEDAASQAAKQAHKDMQSALARAGDIELSLKGIREGLPDICDAAATSISDVIDANTKKYPQRLGRKDAHNDAKPFVKRLRDLKLAAQKPPSATTRSDLKKALQDIIDNNSLTIKVAGVEVYRNPNVMGEDNIKRLRLAIKHIDSLQDESAIRIKNQRILDGLPEQDQLMATVESEVRIGVEGALPRVEALGFSTTLGVLNPSQLRLSATVLYKATRRTYEIDGNLRNIPQLAATLGAAFAR